jgi:hypothetical protein
MTGNRFYVRVRGKVLGPFTLQELASLRDRGQFRRFHEVSEDRSTWASAAGLTELFPASQSSKAAVVENMTPQVPEADRVAEPTSDRESDHRETTAPAEWFYIDSLENRQGPVSTDRLTAFYRNGILDSSTAVWKPGMSEWQELSTVEGLDTSATISSSATEDHVAWRRVATGVTLVLLAIFVTIGTGVLLAVTLLIEINAKGPETASVVLFLGFITALTGFSAQVLETIGYGFCIGAPRKCGAKGVSAVTLVLGIACTALSLLLLIVLLTAAVAHSDRPNLVAQPATAEAAAALLILLNVLTFLLWIAKPFFFQFFLRAASIAVKNKGLSQNIVYVIIFYGVVSLFMIIFFFIPFFYPRFWLLADIPGERGKFLALLGLLMLTLGFYVAWLICYIVVLFRARRTIGSYLARTEML